MCLSAWLPPSSSIIRVCDHTEQQQKKGKWMLGWVNIILTRESLETLKILSQGWVASDLRLAQNTAVILLPLLLVRPLTLQLPFSIQSTVWCWWPPRASLPSTAHHLGYSLTAIPLWTSSNLLEPACCYQTPDDFLPLLLPIRHWSTAPSKAAFSVLHWLLYFQLSAAHNSTPSERLKGQFSSVEHVQPDM